MENENWKDLPDTGNPEPADTELTEADLEAQRWLEELLASTDPDPLIGAEVLAELPAEPEISTEPELSVQPEIPEGLELSAAPEAQEEPVSQSQEEEAHWFEQLESPVDSAPEIGTDEHAVSAHEMTDMADMELEKIIQEAMSEDWDISAIEREILSEPIEEAFPAEGITEDVSTDLYTDGGEDPDAQEGPVRKVRPKRRNGYGLFGLPHLVSTAIWAAICITIGITLGRLIWVCAADVLAFGRPDRDVEITITEADTLDTITEKLYNAGLIKYPQLFKFYADLADVEEEGKISRGTFTLNTQYDYHALVGGMSSSSSYRKTIEVVIPEGYTCAQIFAKLEEYGVCTAAELEQYCVESEFASYWFLEDVPKGTKYCLEGFLFPDTYEFYVGATPKEVFIKLLAGFENQFDEEMVAQLEVLNQTLEAMYKSHGASERFVPLTVKDVVTVASMIEKETAYSGESPTIASVIYNRLSDPYNYPKLQIDATVVYALGGKNDLTSDDLKFDSPYNTYLYDGLPPGAISNPGAFSLKAALNPADTDYRFYALDPTAEYPQHKFFKTLKEHEAFLKSLE